MIQRRECMYWIQPGTRWSTLFSSSPSVVFDTLRPLGQQPFQNQVSESELNRTLRLAMHAAGIGSRRLVKSSIGPLCYLCNLNPAHHWNLGAQVQPNIEPSACQEMRNHEHHDRRLCDGNYQGDPLTPS